MLVYLVPNPVAHSTDRLGLYCLQFFDSKLGLGLLAALMLGEIFWGKKNKRRKKKKAFVLTKREWSQEELS